MKKLFLPIAFTIAFTLLIFGCVLPGGGGAPIKNETVNVFIPKNGTGNVTINATGGGCEDLTDTFMRDTCYMNQASNSSEGISLCFKIKDVSLKDRCIYSIALKRVEFCPQISDSSVWLRDVCYYSHAEASGEDSTCYRIQNASLMKKCQTTVYEKQCSGKDYYDTAVCIALKTKDSSPCAAINRSDECYFEVAKKLPDSSICGNIQNQVAKTACEATVTKNYDLCETLAYNTTQDACYQAIAEETKNYSFCDKTKTYKYITSCYESLALLLNNPSLCASAYKETDREVCYQRVAEKYNDPAVCTSIIERVRRDICRVNIAKAIPDASVCGLVETDYYRNYQSYSNLITNQNAVSFELCSGISPQDASWRDECFVSLVKKTGDLTYCDNIQTEAIKSRCGQ